MSSKNSKKWMATGRSAGDNFFGIVYKGERPFKKLSIPELREILLRDKEKDHSGETKTA